MTLSSFRNDFPMLKRMMHGKPLVYLDSAATAQKPQAMIDAITDFYQNNYGTVHRAVYELSVFSTEKYQQVRRQAQKFLHAAKPEEIIFTRGTTESINMVASSFCKAFVKPRDEILISEMEHHSNIVPWQLACEESGAILKVVPFTDVGTIDLNVFSKMLTLRTKLVALAHISNTLGTVNPVEEMIKMAHAAGAKVLLDGAQAAPHRKVDVQKLDADFYVISGHKLYGPTGIGLLYAKEALLSAMPPYQGGGDMVEIVTFPKTTYNVLPLKFEAGTPMIAEVIGLGAALEYVEKVGSEAIYEWEQKLLAYATPRLLALKGACIYGNAPEKGGIISFNLSGIHALDIGTMLDLKGVAIRTGHHCAQPVMRHFGIQSCARISFALYTSLEDIDRFIEALAEVQKLF